MAANDSEASQRPAASEPTELPLPAPGKKGTKSKARKWRLAALLALVVIAAFIGYQLCCPSDKIQGPFYQGKTARQWFAEAEATPPANFLDSTSHHAFLAMEGDAVPLLLAILKENSISPIHHWYARSLSRLPNLMVYCLPKPRSFDVFVKRQRLAFQLLGAIGMEQQSKMWEGIPWSSKISITNAIPALKRSFNHPIESVRSAAIHETIYLGFLAAPLVPELATIAGQDSRDQTSAISALGTIGPPASNALPVLLQCATNSNPKVRLFAAQALGDIGRANPATIASALATSLDDPEPECRQFALRSLCKTGLTPSDSLPKLRALRQDTNEWFYTYASLALWNQNRQNPELFQAVACALPTNHCGLVFTLADLGPRAAPFVPELERMLSDTNVSVFVLRALRRITNAPMAPQ